MSFLLSKTAFVCELQHTPLWKMIFSQCSKPSVGMRFWGHKPNSLRNKNMERLIPYLLKKWFFWPSKLCYPCRAQGIIFFGSILNVIVLHTVGNKCVRFGGHVDIEVSYKILWLDVLK
jgi:hypothetical protein